MNGLDFLSNKGLITQEFKPVKPTGSISIVKNGVIFQQQCHNGLPYDIAVSWLQKAIRRGLKDQALYCAHKISALGKIFRSHLLNRLIVIMSEDIGPAEPNIVTIVTDLYFKAKSCEKSADLSGMQDIIITMVCLLCESRKSRITDWTIHNTKTDFSDDMCDFIFDDFPSTVKYAVTLCRNRVKSSEWIGVDTKPNTKYKKLEVYTLWNILLDISDSETEDAVRSLLDLFMLRGPEYGLLHLVHAISLCFLEIPDDKVDLPANMPTWDQISEFDFPIMNEAVDAHTRFGKVYLGRTFNHFIYHGSVLDNWTPFPGEQELIEKFKEQLIGPFIENSTPRGYQTDIIDKTMSYFEHQTRGWITMACGTGKTKTSYWVQKAISDKYFSQLQPQQSMTVVIVTPTLEILRQFHSSWCAMNRLNKIESISGILASCRDSFAKDDYSNYEYLTANTIGNFLEYPDQLKFIYTTYLSLPHLINFSGFKPDIVIYDEAHHLKNHHMFNCGYELLLSATPKQEWTKGDVIATYNLRNAINDGHLTPYNVGIFDDEPNTCLEFIQRECNKTIVYCKNNSIAKSLYLDWSANNENAYYIDCKTNKKNRQQIFKDYREKPKAIIFNCAILGEGVDITDCDSVFIHSGYTSETRIVQAICRPLRLHETKSNANIYIMEDGKVEKRLDHIMKYDPDVYEVTDRIE